MIKVSHHLLLCATPTKAICCPDKLIGEASWNTLKLRVRELGLDHYQRPEGIVLRSKADCLRICDVGPVLLIWPHGIVYGEVTPSRIDLILREHIINNNPISEWIVKHYSMVSFGSN